MVTTVARVVFLGLAVTSAQAELQLNPAKSECDLEGVKLKQLAFRDANKNATYQPPYGWDYSGSATQLTLHPPGKAQAEATISKSPLAQQTGFDAESVK